MVTSERPLFRNRVLNASMILKHRLRPDETYVFDAPDIVPDSNKDGKCDAADVQALGLASTVVQSTFHIR